MQWPRNRTFDPYERADITSNTYYDWLLDHVFILVPAQAGVAEFLETFKEFPPRQKAASFSVDPLATKDPSLKERQPFKAFLERDLNTIHALGKQGAFEFAFATHAGMTEDEFEEMACEWFASARHPKLGRLFTQCTYRPQIELLGFLRENGFKTYIVLAADVIETSIAPTWDDIGRLAAIAVIRTFLNYFLERDLADMREREHESDETK